MFHIVYRITHKLTNKFYIGRHSTENINDSYMGSGSHQLLKDKPNLIKEILKIYEKPEEMIGSEIKLISEHINNPLCMNHIVGDPTYGGVIIHSDESKNRIKRGMAKYKQTNPEKFKQHMSNAGKGGKGKPKSNIHKQNLSKVRKGVPKSEEFKKSVSKTLSGRTLRPRNTLCKKWRIIDTINNKEYFVEDRVKFCSENNLNYAAFNVGTRNKNHYKQRWLCEQIL